MSLYADTATLSPANERVVNGFPLAEAQMQAPVVDTDFAPGEQWPPRRVRQRAHRLAAYDKLYRGDFRDFVFDPRAISVIVNYAALMPTWIVRLLMTSEPEVEETEKDAVSMMLADAALNAMLYGRAYLQRVGDEVSSPMTSMVFDGDEPDTGYTIQAVTTGASEDGMPDQLHVVRFEEDSAQRLVFSWANGQITDLIAEEPPEPGLLRLVDRPPVRDQWGQSVLDMLGPLTVAATLRLSGVEHTIAQNEHPLLVVPVELADAGAPSNAARPRVLADSDKPDFIRDIKALRDHDVAWTPGGVNLPEYVEWGGEAMENSFMMLDKLAEELSVMSGIPRVLSTGGEMPSGISLKRQLIGLYASTKQLHNQLLPVAHEVYGATFAWEHPFDLEERQAQEREDMAMAREDDGDDGE